jgi:hypothetical protein
LSKYLSIDVIHALLILQLSCKKTPNTESQRYKPSPVQAQII